MQTRIAASILLVALIGPVLGADPAADKQTLDKASVPSEPAAILKWLRTFAPSDADPGSVKTLIQQLGADEFAERESAVKQLIAMGPRAAPYLRQALRDKDRELAIRAEHCLKVIDAGPGTDIHAAALRLVAHHKPAGAAAALLEYLPFAPHERLADDTSATLEAVAKTGDAVDPAVLAALGDKNAVKRLAAAEVLCKVGDTAQRLRVKKLLADTDLTVRLRVGLALVFAQEKDAIPVLIDLIGQVPAAQHGQIESVLYRLAGNTPPAEPTRAAWAKWWQANSDKIDLAKLTDKGTLLGFTLIAAANEGTLREIDPSGKVRWQIPNLQQPMSLQVLGADRFLIAEYRGRMITERDSKGQVHWEYKVSLPLSAQRLANGNTFIATRTRLTEVDKNGAIVLNQTIGGLLIAAARKLPGGHTVCLTSTGICVRLDAAGKETQRFPTGFGVNFGSDFDVTIDGKIYVPSMARNKVTVFSALGKAEKEYDVQAPDAVTVLPNGHILVASQRNRRVVELDLRGQIRWEHNTELGPTRVQRR